MMVKSFIALLAEELAVFRGGLFVFQLPATKVEAPRGPVPMPESAYRATIEITRPIPPQIDASSSVMLSIEIVNAANTAWVQRDVGAIRAGNHWLDVHGNMLVQDDGRVLLPKGTAEPGAFVDAAITKAGDYELTATVATAKVKPPGA